MEALCLLGFGREMRVIGMAKIAAMPDLLCNFGDCRIGPLLTTEKRCRQGPLGVPGAVTRACPYPSAHDKS